MPPIHSFHWDRDLGNPGWPAPWYAYRRVCTFELGLHFPSIQITSAHYHVWAMQCWGLNQSFVHAKQASKHLTEGVAAEAPHWRGRSLSPHSFFFPLQLFLSMSYIGDYFQETSLQDIPLATLQMFPSKLIFSKCIMRATKTPLIRRPHRSCTQLPSLSSECWTQESEIQPDAGPGCSSHPVLSFESDVVLLFWSLEGAAGDIYYKQGCDKESVTMRSPRGV